MKSLGRYQLIEELGRGAMGVVYRARDPSLGRDVAIKVMLTIAAPDELARFAREAEATAQLRHPSIVAIHGFQQEGGRPYAVMDLVEGRSLQAELEARGPLPPVEAIGLTLQIAEALDYAHRQGVIHRDVKPENVLVDADGRAYLTDLGLARLVGRDTRLTLTGDILGTPVFMPPEQAEGRLDAIGPASDVYALGGTLYTLLTGAAPFRGTSVIVLLGKVLSQRPAPPSTHRPDLDPRLDAVCLRALEKDPADRYESAAAFADALRAASKPAQEVSSSRALWAFGVAAALLIAGLAVGWAVQRGDPPAAVPPVAAPPPTPPQAVDPPPPPATPREHTLTLQPGPLLGEDVYIRADGAYYNDNFGCHGVMSVGVREQRRNRRYAPLIAYLKFDLSRLPDDARVERAELTLHVADFEFGAARVSLDVGGVRTDWIEGTSSLDDTLDGVAFQSDPSVPGLDYVAPNEAPRLRHEVSKGTALVTFDVTELVYAQRPGPTLGLSLFPAEQVPLNGRGAAVQFFTSDSVQPERRPRLTVRYYGTALRPARDTSRLLAENEREAKQIVASLPVDPKQRLEALARAITVAPLDLGLWVRRAEAHGSTREGDLSWRRAHRALEVGCAMHERSAWSARVYSLLVVSGLRTQEPSRMRAAINELDALRSAYPGDYPRVYDEALRILEGPELQDPKWADFRTAVRALPGR